MDIHVYGLSTCDTVRKARQWLKAQGQPHHFHDLRKEPPSLQDWQSWAAQLGWERLLNRQGSTWRGLPATRREAVQGPGEAVALLQEHPAVMKRPLVVWPDASVSVGFDEALFARQSAR